MKNKNYKYYPLEQYLLSINGNEISLTFEEIETIIEETLPPSAFKHPQWWYTHPESQTKSWTNANFQAKVDLNNKQVIFSKIDRFPINQLDNDKIMKDMRKKLESVGFIFEKEQTSHMQNRKLKEYKFIHPDLINKFVENGLSIKAKKFYLKALNDGEDFNIGFVTGSSSPLIKLEIFQKPNSKDSFDDNPAWVNKENDLAFNKLIESIKNYLNIEEKNKGYWTFFCNPKYWDIKNFLMDLNNGTQSEIDSWRISDYHKDLIKKGDYGVIRVGIDKRTRAELNGDEKVYPGVYAIVKVLEKPYFEEMIDDSDYWNDSEPVSKRKYKVKIEFIKNFIDKPILFEKYGELLSEDKYLVKGFQASSMPLLPDVFQKIRELKNIEIENLNDKDFLDTVSTNLEQIYHDLENTERETIVKTRIGQNLFKDKLLKQSCKCKMCGLDEEELLIASHIKPWKDSNNLEKLDIYNGFLLCPIHDKLFDYGLISFDDTGKILISSKIDKKNYSKLNIDENLELSLLEGHLKYLSWHRQNFFKRRVDFIEE